MDSKAEAVMSPAPCADCCAPVAAERTPRAIPLRPARATRSAPALAKALVVRPALTSTRLAAALTVGLRARLPFAVTPLEPALDRRLLAADLVAVTGLWVSFLAAVLRGRRCFILAIHSSRVSRRQHRRNRHRYRRPNWGH